MILLEEKKQFYERYLLAYVLVNYIDLSLYNGYLNISAKCERNNDNEEEKYIHQERFYGECSRSFYVGDEIKEEDIKAEFKNGILKINIHKLDEAKKINID